MGKHKGVNTGTDRTRSSGGSKAARKKRVARRLPARTIWKGAFKQPPMKKKPRAKGPTPNCRWLWMAVTVGKHRTKFTHENELKKVTFAILPRREEAPNRKPRGLRSMSKVIRSHIKRKTFLVFDGWKSSKAAVQKLGYRHAPPVNHSKGWRDRETGFHSNDVESENARLKLWLRARYTILSAHFTQWADNEDGPTMECHEAQDYESLDLYEYCHYVNIGSSMYDVMASVALAAGPRQRRLRVR